jgi:hypothetical protein
MFAACVNRSNRAQKLRVAKERDDGLFQLNARRLKVPMTRNAEAVKNHPGRVRLVERVEMDTANMISHKVMALFQRVLNAKAPNHLRIVLASL